MPAISIIVPVYKVEPYICCCIDSILSQTYSDFELILVDDGSPDKCGAICDEYAEKDSRIRVIHQVNGGVSSARNAGLDVAKGKYIYFVDSDDYIEPELLKTVLFHMESGLDMVVFASQDFYEDGRIWNRVFKQGVYTLGTPGDINDFIVHTLLPWKIGFSVWDKVFVRSIIEKFHIRFVDSRAIFAEDLHFCLCYCAHVKHIRVIDTCLYNYRKWGGSVMAGRKAQIVVNHFNELGKALLRYYESCDDCYILIENFDTIQLSIV